MVTIDPDKTILNVPKLNRTDHQPNVQKGEFDAVFQEAIGSTEIKSTKSESTHFVSDIRPAQFATEPLPSTDMIVNQVQRLIDTMEAYQQKLIEKDATLKEIQTLVQKMESESESLSNVKNSIIEQESLKTIADQSLMLSSMEIAKFNSGRYNDP